MNTAGPEVPRRIKRTRKPWVYASEYNHLEKKYHILKWVAITGWILFAFALKFVV